MRFKNSKDQQQGRTSVQVGRQDEGNTFQPVHHGYRLRLPGLRDVDKLVGKVTVQVKVVAVVTSAVAPHVT